jgi:hypothetical protein
MAPWTVQNCPDPSRATVIDERLLGAAAAVLKRQVVEPLIANVPPPGGRIAPESTVT